MNPENECVTDKIPPQALDVERRVMASILYSRSQMARAVRVLVPDDFYNTDHRNIFSAVLKTGNVEPEIVLRGIYGRDDGDGLRALIDELSTNTATCHDIEPYLKILKEQSARRRLIEQSERTIQACHNPEIPIIDAIGRVMQAGKEILEQSFENDIENRVYLPTLENCPADAQPLIELSNVRILTRGNLAMITACAGAGKSSVLEAACSSVLNPMCDTLGLSVNGKSLLYIDSERSRLDHNHSWQRYLQRAGMDPAGKIPESVRFENIKSIESLNDRLNYLWSRLDAANVPEIVLLDGIGDFVADPNDSDECTPLVYRLGSIADVRNIGIMVSLHNNPSVGSDKARGVLGSELWRKAESVLIIEKIPGDDVRRLTTDYSLGKNRGGSDAISSYFKWDPETKMHVSCAAPAEAKGKTIVIREKILALVGTRAEWSYSELQTAIMENTGIAKRTAGYKISDLITLTKIIKNENGTYSIAEKSHRKHRIISMIKAVQTSARMVQERCKILSAKSSARAPIYKARCTCTCTFALALHLVGFEVTA
jgi:hypothetical protein